LAVVSLSAAAAALLLAACGAAPGGSPPAAAPAPDGSWQLVSGSGPEGPLATVEGRAITLDVEEGQIGGISACNHYGASAQIHGERLELGELVQTQMGCEPEVMAAERAYLAALARAERIRRSGSRLVISGPAAELRFAELPPVPLDELGTTMELETLVEGGVARTPVAPARLRLADDGTLEGDTGCRRVSGRYVIRAGEVLVTRLSTDDPDGECPPEAEAQDRLVLAVLGDGFSVDADGDRVTLTSNRDSLVFHAG
jgi:heat shock protein HslJ